jgi:hypothetical protein
MENIEVNPRKIVGLKGVCLYRLFKKFVFDVTMRQIFQGIFLGIAALGEF